MSHGRTRVTAGHGKCSCDHLPVRMNGMKGELLDGHTADVLLHYKRCPGRHRGRPPHAPIRARHKKDLHHMDPRRASGPLNKADGGRMVWFGGVCIDHRA